MANPAPRRSTHNMIQGSWFTPWRLPRSAGQASTEQPDRRRHGTVRERRHVKSGRGALVAKLGHPPPTCLLPPPSPPRSRWIASPNGWARSSGCGPCSCSASDSPTEERRDHEHRQDKRYGDCPPVCTRPRSRDTDQEKDRRERAENLKYHVVAGRIPRRME